MTAKTDRYQIGLAANPIFLTQPDTPDGSLELRSGDASTAGTLIKRLDTPVSAGTVSLAGQAVGAMTGIPAWAKRVTVVYNSVAPSGTFLPVIQLGTTAGYVSTGYSCSTTFSYAGPTISTNVASNGCALLPASSTGVVMAGVVTLLRIGATNAWVISHSGIRTDTTGTSASSAVISLPGTMDRVRLATDAVTAFTSGTLSFLFE